MANSRNYRVPTKDDKADVPYWNDLLAQDVAKDIVPLLPFSNGTDPRLLEINDEEPDYSFGILDMYGRRLWLEAGANGGPSPYAAQKIAGSPEVIAGVGNGVGIGEIDPTASDLSFSLIDINNRRLEFETGPDGKVTPRILAAWASRMGTVVGSGSPDYPSADWAHWGDSMTAGGYPAIMATLTGRNHYNGGIGGQTSEAIAARQGGVPTLLAVTGNTIPASGTVGVTIIKNSLLNVSTSRGGSIAGVAGTLTRDASGVYTFARTLPGNETAVPSGTMFIPSDAVDNRARTVVIWTGRNGVQYTDQPAYIVSQIRAMIDYLTPRVKRVIVMEIAPDAAETPGTANRAKVDAGNAALAAAFPAEWLPIATYLRTAQAATDAGIVFTADDNTDIANGITPRSLRSDTLHLNTAGNTAVAKRVYAEAQTRRWI